jgi:hypothetical protein
MWLADAQRRAHLQQVGQRLPERLLLLQRLPMSGAITLIVAIYVMPSLFTPVWRTVTSWLDAPLR